MAQPCSPQKGGKVENDKSVRFNISEDDTPKDDVPIVDDTQIGNTQRSRRCWSVAPEDPGKPCKFVLDPNASKLLMRRRQRKKEQEQKSKETGTDSVEGSGTPTS